MASNGSSEDEIETSLDVSGFMRAFSRDNADDDAESDENNERTVSAEISMFCKACLHPYCGEQKAGTIVLRCERCGQTDTVLEERVDTLDPQEWIGNLMMNRFMQVVKEQEDISANLTDPMFTNDDFQKYALAISEYTYNIEKLGSHLFDIAERTGVASHEVLTKLRSFGKDVRSVACHEEVQAYAATKVLIELHKMLVVNEPVQDEVPDKGTIENENDGNINDSSKQDDEKREGGTEIEEIGMASNSEQVDNARQVDKPIGEKKDIVIKTEELEELDPVLTEEGGAQRHNANKLLENTREHLCNMGTIIMRLVESIIVKYKLPAGIWRNVEEKLWAKSVENETDNTGDKETNNGDEDSQNIMKEDEEESRDIPRKNSTDDELKSKEQSDEIVSKGVLETSQTNDVGISDNEVNVEKTDDAGSWKDDLDNSKEMVEDGTNDGTGSGEKERIGDGIEGDQSDGKSIDIETDGMEKEGPPDKIEFNIDPSKKAGNVDSEGENGVSDESDDEREFFCVTTKTIKTEVYAALADKLKLRFDEAPRKPQQFNQERTDVFCSDLAKIGAGEELVKDEDEDKSIEKICFTQGEAENSAGETETTTTEDSNIDENADDDEEGETISVNFYQLSTEFIKELQRRKADALRERKDKALGKIHEKVDTLKTEMEKVEAAVTKELNLAYKKKMRKVEKQRQDLDEKRRQVRRAERLLDYYAMTGQEDKISEIAEQFNNIHDN